MKYINANTVSWLAATGYYTRSIEFLDRLIARNERRERYRRERRAKNCLIRQKGKDEQTHRKTQAR